MQRISTENYYLDIAQTVLERATCLRRVYGAIIVKNDEIISTGYNGAPRGRRNCVDMGYCVVISRVAGVSADISRIHTACTRQIRCAGRPPCVRPR